jgi:hypothetical protein
MKNATSAPPKTTTDQSTAADGSLSRSWSRKASPDGRRAPVPLHPRYGLLCSSCRWGVWFTIHRTPNRSLKLPK